LLYVRIFCVQAAIIIWVTGIGSDITPLFYLLIFYFLRLFEPEKIFLLLPAPLLVKVEGLGVGL